jgi:flagellin-like protein
MRRMKGISPLVATVLLIAVTMTIAGMLAYWASSFVKTQTQQFENQTLTTECRFAEFRFYTCSYNSTSQTMSFILENFRSVGLKNLVAYLVYQNGTIANYSLNADLPGGTMRGFTIDGISPDYSVVIIKTHCTDVDARSACR